MTPRARVIRLAGWAVGANVALITGAAALGASSRATEAARQVLILCGLAG